MDDWVLPGLTKATQSVTHDWDFTGQRLIDGVAVREIRNVPSGHGVLTEIFRRDWRLDDLPVDQVFQVMLASGGISAWHGHAQTTDRLFVASGLIKIVLYDARTRSSSHGTINEFQTGQPRPTLIVVPPGVFHGVQTVSSDPALLLNLVDRAYSYEDPDHWRLPWDSSSTPYRFKPDESL